MTCRSDKDVLLEFIIFFLSFAILGSTQRPYALFQLFLKLSSNHSFSLIFITIVAFFSEHVLVSMDFFKLFTVSSCKIDKTKLLDYYAI